MPFAFTMPKLSPTMDEGVIARWLKKEGDFVEANEVLLEITTDKATVEHAVLDEGWLKKILVPEGKNVKVNAPLAIFAEKKEEDISQFLEGLQKKKESEKKPQAVPLEEMAPPEERGTLRAEPSFAPEPPLKEYDYSKLIRAPKKRLAATPLAKKMAREKGIDLSSISGSGPQGRIEAKDLERAKEAGLTSWEEREFPQELPGSFEEIELTPMRKAIGKRLQESKSFIPHYYLKRTIDGEPLVEIRQQLENLGLKITYNDLIIRALALSLRKHPQLNSGFNSKSQSIIQFKTIDISVAIGFDGGLITPIIRVADFKDLRTISEEMADFKARARLGKLREEEYRGGSFTLSNLGMYGISEFVAVINPPQSAILAVGNIEESPRIRNGSVVPGKNLVLTLSCDHRVIDGATGAQFLATLKTFLENPSGLII